MKSTQNEKISQIKFSTLVVGIDVAKETHCAHTRAHTHTGTVLLCVHGQCGKMWEKKRA